MKNTPTRIVLLLFFITFVFAGANAFAMTITSIHRDVYASVTAGTNQDVGMQESDALGAVSLFAGAWTSNYGSYVHEASYAWHNSNLEATDSMLSLDGHIDLTFSRYWNLPVFYSSSSVNLDFSVDAPSEYTFSWNLDGRFYNISFCFDGTCYPDYFTPSVITGTLMPGDHTFSFSAYNDDWHYRDLHTGFDFVVQEGSPVPIPSAVMLLGSGVLGLVGFRRCRSKH